MCRTILKSKLIFLLQESGSRKVFSQVKTYRFTNRRNLKGKSMRDHLLGALGEGGDAVVLEDQDLEIGAHPDRPRQLLHTTNPML